MRKSLQLSGKSRLSQALAQTEDGKPSHQDERIRQQQQQQQLQQQHSLKKHLVQFHNLNESPASASGAATATTSSSSCSPSSTTSSYSIADLLSPGKKPNHTSMDLICQVCHQTFGSAPDLEQHRLSQHSETFPCSWCKEIFYSLAGLTRHVNRFHSTGLPWIESRSSPPQTHLPLQWQKKISMAPIVNE